MRDAGPIRSKRLGQADHPRPQTQNSVPQWSGVGDEHDHGRSRPPAQNEQWRITQDEYDKKARELKERQAEILLRIEQHHGGEGSFRTTLESLISVASRAAEIFKRSNIEQKRELIAFVFSNLRLSGKKLNFSLRSPFDLMVNRTTYWPSWIQFEPSGSSMSSGCGR